MIWNCHEINMKGSIQSLPLFSHLHIYSAPSIEFFCKKPAHKIATAIVQSVITAAAAGLTEERLSDKVKI